MITDIEGQNAHGVMFLDLTTRPKLVKSALGHARENVNLKTGENSVKYFCCRYRNIFKITIGSMRSSWSLSANEITSIPKVRNVPSKKRSIRNI